MTQHLPIVRYVPSGQIQRTPERGGSSRFAQVEAGPLVRSSYQRRMLGYSLTQPGFRRVPSFSASHKSA